jgi:hypothetical protein
MLSKILQSKKAVAFVVTLLVEALVYFIPLGEAEKMETRIHLMNLIAIIGVGYQGGQGLADLGKEKAKVEGKVNGNAPTQ